MIEKLREELIEDIITFLDEGNYKTQDVNIQNTITQIIVDTFDDYELKVTGSNRFNKAENSMAQEAKFELLNYKTTKQGVRFDGAQETQFIDYIVKLTDADGEVVRYSITDYYNEGMSEIIDTRIWVLSDKILDDLQVKNDSRLGIKILGFITSEHFYRNDVLESMYVKEMEDKIDSYYEK